MPLPSLTPPPPAGAPLLEPRPLITQGQGGLSQSIDQSPPQQLSRVWSGWFRNLYNYLNSGKTEDVVIAGVTLHFVKGIYQGHS